MDQSLLLLIKTFSSSNQTILKGPAFSDTNNTEIQWENFGPGEPSNGGRTGEDCVYAYASGAWNDANCNDQSEYICEKIAPTRPKLGPKCNEVGLFNEIEQLNSNLQIAREEIKGKH